MKLLTLPEFAAAAAEAVRASGAAPENRQAKAVPAERMVRYYTARGLLPRPGNAGRALTYGRTHLVRLVAIKRLQGQGLSLDDIAARLEGMSQDDVEALAAIPAGAMPADLGDPQPTAEPARAAGTFWRTVPAAASVAPVAAEPAVTSLQAVRLSDTVTLLLDGSAGPLPPLDSLRSAATPLLDLLATAWKDSP
ncbi:MerR family transcriptional regulator [Mycobacterium vicinigordonae]|uniref:MerR family transcriptional regulator n=1 Tax=Mycobacterium vicinigordonae TaxID=1719132 RepID=A0A7D6ITI2_9MYCO|nr:MerR family transcriptional regulator [Mycobacterium vicinigordonae]QLL08479.1 MerR family transcriptional regulator [Mycobacterium vicinigordonae]